MAVRSDEIEMTLSAGERCESERPVPAEPISVHRSPSQNMVSRPKLKLVEFYHHRGDETDAGNIDADNDADVSDAFEENTEGTGGTSERSEGTDGTEEAEGSSGSWLRRLGGVALLGGVAFVLVRRWKETDEDISFDDYAREDDTVSRITTDDPASRLRDQDDAEGGIDATTQAGADTDLDDEAIGTGTDVEAVDPESGREAVGGTEDVTDAEGVGSGVDVDAIDTENGNRDEQDGSVKAEHDATDDDPTASANVASDENVGTDVGLSPKADAETDAEAGNGDSGDGEADESGSAEAESDGVEDDGADADSSTDDDTGA